MPLPYTILSSFNSFIGSTWIRVRSLKKLLLFILFNNELIITPIKTPSQTLTRIRAISLGTNILPHLKEGIKLLLQKEDLYLGSVAPLQLKPHTPLPN